MPVMSKILLGLFAAAFVLVATPASAQWRFDKRIDPSNCRWWQICDYGGRAILPYRVRHHVYIQRRYRPVILRRARCDCPEGPRTIIRTRY
jgi:hypothetical protein